MADGVRYSTECCMCKAKHQSNEDGFPKEWTEVTIKGSISLVRLTVPGDNPKEREVAVNVCWLTPYCPDCAPSLDDEQFILPLARFDVGEPKTPPAFPKPSPAETTVVSRAEQKRLAKEAKVNLPPEDLSGTFRKK